MSLPRRGRCGEPPFRWPPTAIVAAAIAGTVAWTARPSALPPVVTRFPILLGDGQTFTNSGRQELAISRDGTQIVYVANQRLYLRRMSEAQATPIAGTEGVQNGVTNPVFSPDGSSIAFASVFERVLKKIATTGGAAVTICPAGNPDGVSWDRDEILFGQSGKGIMRVTASGGTPELVIGVKSGERAYGPQMLPGGEAVLFTLSTTTDGPDAWDSAQIVVQSLKSAARTTLGQGADARYLPTGHIVYARGGIVFAIRFDLRRLAIVGGPVPVIEGVRRAISGISGVAQFSVSDHGTLVYVPGPQSPSEAQFDLAFMDRQGAVQRLKLPPASYEQPRVSPDGARVAVGTDNGTDANVWIYDLSGSSSRRQLTFGGRNEHPRWSADGLRVAFASNREGDRGIFWQRADGAGVAERLTKAEPGTAHIPQSWAPDGKTLLFTEARGAAFSLRAFSLQDRKAAPYGDVEATSPIFAEFSPDGRWVAYVNAGVYVQPFPATGAKYLIHGGIHPFWSPDGTELFSDAVGRFAVGNFAVVSIRTKPTFTVGNPVEISRAALRGMGPNTERNVDVMPDGKRFVGVVDVDQAQSGTASGPQIQVVEHWFEELRQRVPSVNLSTSRP